jgi:hypothetical protein
MQSLPAWQSFRHGTLSSRFHPIAGIALGRCGWRTVLYEDSAVVGGSKKIQVDPGGHPWSCGRTGECTCTGVVT